MRSTATRKALTVKAVDALKSARPGTRYTVYDALVPGFGVRVSDKRKRTFIMYRRLGKGGRPVRYTLSEYVPGAKDGDEGSLDHAPPRRAKRSSRSSPVATRKKMSESSSARRRAVRRTPSLPPRRTSSSTTSRRSAAVTTWSRSSAAS
jgi:hypothetical protein